MYTMTLLGQIMATNLRSTVNTCELCSLHFSDPRILPCLHSFCYECLSKHFDERKSGHSCPTCNEAFEVLDGNIEALPVDLHGNYVAEVAEYEEKVKNQSGVNCDRCIVSSESVAVKFCCNCCKFLCNWCTQDHTRRQKTHKHELIEVGEKKQGESEKSLLNSIPRKAVNCQLHSDEVLKFYCTTCSCLICRDCMALSHAGHSYDRIEVISKREKGELLLVIENADGATSKLEDAMANGEKVIQNIKTKRQLVDDKIKECFQDLHKALNQREESLLAKNSEIELKKTTALKLQGEDMKKMYCEITRVVGLIKEAVDSYAPAEMLAVKKTMETKLKALIEQFNNCSLDSCKNEYLSTSFNTSVTKEEIQKFGEVNEGCSAANSTVSLYKPQAINGKEKTVLVTTRDEQGQPFLHGGDMVKATLEVVGSNDYNVEGKVKDNENGTYEIFITPRTIGEHQLNITIGNERIKQSPFIISVQKQRPYTSLSCIQYINASSSPWDVAFSDDGEMFVAVYGYHCVEVMNKQGTLLRTIGNNGTSGAGNLQFSSPSAIAIRGNVVYVTEDNNHRVQKFTTSGEYISTFGSSGSGQGQLSNPRGICIDPEGKVYVSEYSNNRISVFGADGSFDHHITGNLSNPWGITFDPSGNLHVANYSTLNVAMFSPEGKFINVYGGNDLSYYPSGIAIDPEGFIFVTEYSSMNFTVFDSKHQYFTGITGLSNPVGITMDEDGNIYVCDSSNCQINKY